MSHSELPPKQQEYLARVCARISAGDYSGAAVALNTIAPAFQGHPHVLATRWLLESTSGNWDNCLEMARGFLGDAAETSASWLQVASVLKEIGREQDAYGLLSRVVPRFPDDADLRRELGRICIAVGNAAEGQTWLLRAADLGPKS